MKSPYTILGVNKQSTEQEIRKAYISLAMKWHPDKNPDNKEEAEIKFKEINEAYDSLSNVSPSVFSDLFPNSDMTDILATLFGNFVREDKKPSGTVLCDTNVTLNELYTGTIKIINYERKILDTTIPNKICEQCKGRGFISFFKTNTNSISLEEESSKCKNCNNGFTGKLITKNETMTFEIKPGTQDDHKIVIPNMGNQTLYGNIGDLVIQLVNHKHYFYTRSNDDLLIKYNLTFKEALLGFKRKIKTLDDKLIKLKVKGPFKMGEKKIINGLGMPIQDTNKFGNLVISLTFDMPNNLNNKQIKAISNSF